jgi:hypothetical protein
MRLEECQTLLNNLTMIKVDFTYEMVFSFEGPNLCLLGNEEDFKMLGKAILDLTVPNKSSNIEITNLNFAEMTGDRVKIIFASKQGADIFGKIVEDGKLLLFELDNRYWERILNLFALMSWDKRTYYLNSFEDCLKDLALDQEVHLICSSEF